MKNANKTKTLLVEKTEASQRHTTVLKKSENSHKTESKKVLCIPETHYWSTLDKVLEGCQVIGFDFRYLYLNDAVAAHGRRTKEELLGHTMMEVYPGIENTEMFARLRRCMEKRTSHRLENEFIFLDGTKGWFELCMEPVPEGVLILSWEITHRLKVEQAMKAERDTAQKYLDIAEVMLIAIDAEQRVTLINRKGCEILGLSKMRLSAKTGLTTFFLKELEPR